MATDEDIFVWGEFNVKVELGEDIQVVLARVKSNIKLKEGYEDPDFLWKITMLITQLKV